jgi:hypothetical protein
LRIDQTLASGSASEALAAEVAVGAGCDIPLARAAVEEARLTSFPHLPRLKTFPDIDTRAPRIETSGRAVEVLI